MKKDIANAISAIAPARWTTSSDCVRASQLLARTGKLAVQSALGDSHGAAAMRDQRIDDSFLGFEAGVRDAGRGMSKHQFEHAADDVQIRGFRAISESN